jgi:hypothetical protein
VDELYSKLQNFQHHLKSLRVTAKRIESSKHHKPEESEVSLQITKGLEESQETLKALFDRKDELRKHGTGSAVGVVIQYWLYTHGGKDDVDRAVTAISDRINTIQTAVISINTYVCKLGTQRSRGDAHRVQTSRI